MQTLSKAKVKLFSALQTKKGRYRERRFVIEGKKMVAEAISSDWQPELVVVREDLADNWLTVDPGVLVCMADGKSFRQISSLQHPEGVLALMSMPPEQSLPSEFPAEAGLLLDGIQDPGNLGSMIRIADWFGIPHLWCGPGTVDLWNPKVLRSTMGSVFRVKIRQFPVWPDWLIAAGKNRIWLADLEGEALDTAQLQANDWLMIGNEANGISDVFRRRPDLRKLTIPRFGEAESLNAAVSAGILAWKLRSP